jgi:acyl-CoA synthetase (AMP-forming)/AMP-acid ligase II
MLALMPNVPLLVRSLLEHAARVHAKAEIVSRASDGTMLTYTYADCWRRVNRVAHAFAELGLRNGERVATIAWNSHRHLEVSYAVAGMGAIIHPVNPLLSRTEIAYVLQHAEDKYVCVDAEFLPLIEELAPACKDVRHIIVLDAGWGPNILARNVIEYEAWLAARPDVFAWPEIDERDAWALCYTSGTTGNPKGVLHGQRSTVLQTLALCMQDGFGIHAGDVVMPVVAMFHVHAWGLPYAATMAGAKLVLGGRTPEPPALHDLLTREKVTLSAGVPTVWLGLLEHLRRTGLSLQHLQRAVIGGSAAPGTMIEALERQHGVTVLHTWGMTEMSPLGTVSHTPSSLQGAPQDTVLAWKAKQGRPVYGIELKITDDTGQDLPRDGRATGRLKARGLWVTTAYYRQSDAVAVDGDQWFDTGDVATIDELGYMQVKDRAKDGIRMAGEWVSTIEMESRALKHPGVKEAAVIGIPHPVMIERPLLVCTRRDDCEVDREVLLAYMRVQGAGWCAPGDVVFVSELPRTATGKIRKRALREQLANHVWPD